MKYFLFISLIFLTGVSIASNALAQTPGTNSLSYGKFGKMPLYKGAGPLETLILVLSGEEGWSQKLDVFSRKVATPSVAVLGIDLPKFRAKLEAGKSKCLYPAGDLENLSRFAQTELGFAEPKSPVLIGSGEGAALAYATHAQSPENTFSGVVSLGFCPHYKSTRSLCAGDALRSKKSGKAREFELLPPPEKHPVRGWTSIVSVACGDKANAFVKGVPGAKLVAANDDTGTEAVRVTADVVKETPAAENVHPGKVEALKDLPLILVEAPNAKADSFVVFYSGDGGWAGFDKDVSKAFNNRGFNVVGLSTLSYYWKKKSPEQSAEDLKRIIETFQAKWGVQKYVLVGYSFGADVLPFLAARLPESLQKNMRLITLMSASGLAEFEFHVSNWLSSEIKGQPIIPEMEKLAGKVKYLCLYGDEEKDAFCPKLDAKRFTVVKLSGGHRFDGDSAGLVTLIEKENK